MINQKGHEINPSTNPHLFFLATKIIALTPKTVMAIWAMVSKKDINFGGTLSYGTFYLAVLKTQVK